MTFGLALVLVGLAHPLAGAGSDIWGNVAPAAPLGSGGLYGRYPLGHYALDQHFDFVSVSFTKVDASGVGPMIAYVLASILWALTSFLASALIALFAFAFSLDLVNGSSSTGGAGALVPVSQAIHSLYANVFGGPWLVLAVSVTGLWAMWKALIQRRYSETAGALALSLIYVVVALFFVAEPARTIGAASEWTNKMSVAFLSVTAHGSPSGGEQARDGAAQQLFDLLVAKPWAVMEFGGLEHCAVAGTGSEDSDPDSVAVRPLSPDAGTDAALARRLASGTEVAAGRKSCVNNANKYGAHFLRFGLGTDERNAEYDALDYGDASKLPDADTERRGYRLGVPDKPATDAMEEGGQYQRLLLAIVVFFGELGAFCLLGALSVGVILSQVLLLVLLAFAPLALVAAAIPGRGHTFFQGWLEKLVGFLLRKAAYSLVLAVLLAVNGALATATSSLGWLMSFGLQALFFWAVFLQRRQLTEGLIGIATGPGAPGREDSLRLLGLYYGARAVRRPFRRAGGSPGVPERLGGGGSGSRRNARGDGPGLSGSAPRFGKSHRTFLGLGAHGPERGSTASDTSASGREGASISTEAGRAPVSEPVETSPPPAKGEGRRGRAGEAALAATAREASAESRAARREAAGSKVKRVGDRDSAPEKSPAKPASKERPGPRVQVPDPARRSAVTGEEGSLGDDLRAERESTQKTAPKREAQERPERTPAPSPSNSPRQKKGGEG